MRRALRGPWLAAAAVAGLLGLSAPAGAQNARSGAATARQAPSAAPATLVLLVRHGEKAAAPADDPPLSDAGRARAQALAAALADARVSAIVVSSRRRTLDTAAPLAAARRLTPEVVPIGGSTTEHVAAVAAAVRRHAGGVVLVVGHSNTIPAIVAALGGPRLPDLCDASYATLLALELPADGAPRLVRAAFGAPDPADAATCAAMRP